jgi:hypothetical protein
MPSYTVTTAAPPKVAGHRVVAGDTLELTEQQARYELTAGHIAPTSNAVDAVADEATVKAGSKRR